MNVGYLNAGASLSAANWNPLWTEFDRKVGLLMDGKSMAVISDVSNGAFFIPGLSGKVFFFLGASARAGFGPRYDHSVFTAAAASLPLGDRDDGRHIVGTLGHESSAESPFWNAAGIAWPFSGAPLLVHSLEAHTRIVTVDGHDAPYFLQEGLSTVPEKKYRYAVAELVFEGWGDSVDIPAAWNKYNFFRIHNLSMTSALRVKFAGSGGPGGADFEVTIPALGCRCVRRDSVTSGYDATLRYFWIFKSGDPRFLQQLDELVGIGKEVYATMPANNVANPAVLFRWIDYFERDTSFSGVHWFRDPHAVYDLGTYSGKFGDAAQPGTIVGDLIHHKGAMTAKGATAADDRTIDFDGYASLGAKVAAAGLILTESAANVSISAPGGSGFQLLRAQGVNLLIGAQGQAVTFRSLAGPVVIDARWPSAALGQPFLKEFKIVTAIDIGGVATWNDPVLDAGGNWGSEEGGSARCVVTALNLVLTGATAPAMKIWKDTVGQVCTLRNFVSVEDLPLTYCAFQNVRMALTIFGPELHYELVVSLSGSPVAIESSGLFAEVIADPMTRFEGSYAIQKRVLQWPAVGWGTLQHPGFFTPRLPRKYSLRPYTVQLWTRHPDIVDEEGAINGSDFDLESIGESYLDSDITALCAATLERPGGQFNGTDNFGVWTNPDDLFAPRANAIKIYMPRVYELVEIFNTMAAWVNGLKKAKPITFANSRNYIAPNDQGVGFTDLVPNDLYAAVAAVHPIVPTSHSGLGGLRAPVHSVPVSFAAGAANGSVGAESVGGYADAQVVGIGAGGFDTKLYLSIANVWDYAESIGFKFIYEMVCRPLGTVFVQSSATGEATRDWTTPTPPDAQDFPEFVLPAFYVFCSEADALNWRSHGGVNKLKSDAQPGNKVYGGDASPHEGRNPEVAFRVGLDVNPLVAKNLINSTISAYVTGSKRADVSNVVSAGITVETVAILTPRETFRHTTTDYSGESMTNFRKFWFFGAGVLPLGVEGAGGGARVVPCVSPTNITRLAAAAPEEELVVRFCNVVLLD